MKIHIRILSLIVMLVMIFSGCKGGEMDIRGSFKPLDSTADPNADKFYGGTYTNEFFGIKGSFSANWEIQNSENVSDDIIALQGGSVQHKFFHLYVVPINWLPESSVTQYFKNLHEVLVEKNFHTIDGDYFTHDLTFLGKNVKADMVYSIPTKTKCRTLNACIGVLYERYAVILEVTFCDNYCTPEVVQEFLHESFTLLEDSIARRVQ